MSPTFRCIKLLALGAPLWFFWVILPMGWIIPCVYLTVLALVIANEVARLPTKDTITARRVLPGRFSFDCEQEVALALTNESSQNLRIALVETPPLALELLSEFEAFAIAPGQTMRLTYRVLPIKRGAHTFGAIHLRFHGAPGLVQRQTQIRQDDEVKIYPRFLGVDQYDLLAKIDQKEEAVRIPRALRGNGSDFESLRPYLPGEDLRQVDWKVSARRGALISRNLQIEKGQQLSVLIDAGRFMNEKIDQYTRFEHALNAAIMLCYVAQTRGDAVSVACFSNRIESFLPPIKGAAIMPKVLESLYRVESRPIEADYWHIVAQVMSRLKKRGLMIMMTDIMDRAGSTGLMRNLIRAAKKHLVLCVVFVEPGIYSLASSTSENADDAYLKAAASHLAVQRQLALEEMRAKGILVLETSPKRLSISLIQKYLEMRQRN